MKALKLSVALLSLCPAAAMAQVTPEEVWNLTSAASEAVGFEVSGVPSRNGDVLTIREQQLRAILPMGAGFLQVDLPDVTYTDLGDGRVRINWPAEGLIGFMASLPGEDPVEGALRFSGVAYSSQVSGSADDMTFESTTAGLDFRVETVDIPNVSLDFNGTGGAFNQTTRITRDAAITISVAYDQEPFAIDGTFVFGPEDARISTSRTRGVFEASNGTYDLVLPPGMSLMNLSPALRAGLSMALTSTSGGNAQETLTYVEGIGETYDQQTIGPNETRLGFDASGLTIAVKGENIDAENRLANLMSFAFQADAFETLLQLPLLAQPDPQDAALVFGIDGLTIGDELWAMIDPLGALPRDPASLRLDFAGAVALGEDIPDIDHWMTMGPRELPDITPLTLTINAANLGALGAAVESSGAFAFDMTDTETLDGFPLPVGTAAVLITGAQALLDHLEAAEIASPSDIGGARFALGGFTRSVGDDRSELDVEVTPDGGIFFNGNRIR